MGGAFAHRLRADLFYCRIYCIDDVQIAAKEQHSLAISEVTKFDKFNF